jgi:methionine sulfoxide reductase heme-binding subunit
MSISTDLIWVIARSTGTASLVALTLSVLTGIALRTGTFAWLSHNRGVRVVHGFLTVLWIPLGLAHVIALLFDRYAQIGILDLIVPFGVSYGRLAIGLGTISAQLILVVLVSTWLRSWLTLGQWRAFDRLSYVAFGAAFAHGIMSGTDLANPVVAVSRGSPPPRSVSPHCVVRCAEQLRREGARLPGSKHECVSAGPFRHEGLEFDPQPGLGEPSPVCFGIGVAPPHIAAAYPEPVLLKPGPCLRADRCEEQSAGQ